MTGHIDYDECDACGLGVKAVVYYVMPSGSDVSYCNHHSNRFRGEILAQGGKMLYDFSYLNE